MFFLGLAGTGTNNFAYSWGLLYILCTTRYFYEHRSQLVSSDYSCHELDDEDLDNVTNPPNAVAKDEY